MPQDKTSLIAASHPTIDILALHLDTTKEQAIQEAIAQTIAKFGRIDVAINVAGIGHSETTMECDFVPV